MCPKRAGTSMKMSCSTESPSWAKIPLSGYSEKLICSVKVTFLSPLNYISFTRTLWLQCRRDRVPSISLYWLKVVNYNCSAVEWNDFYWFEDTARPRITARCRYPPFFVSQIENEFWKNRVIIAWIYSARSKSFFILILKKTPWKRAALGK